jgi:hypothetical protein
VIINVTTINAMTNAMINVARKNVIKNAKKVKKEIREIAESVGNVVSKVIKVQDPVVPGSKDYKDIRERQELMVPPEHRAYKVSRVLAKKA